MQLNRHALIFFLIYFLRQTSGIVYDGQYYNKRKRIYTQGTINKKWTKSREIGNIGHTRWEKYKAKAQHNMCWKPSHFRQKYCLADFLSL